MLLFLWLLLVNVVGPRSFEDLQTVNGHLCVTYREACEHLGLLENDAHWDSSHHGASIASSPHKIRMLYVIIITTCFP